MADLFANMKQQTEEVKENIGKKLPEVKIIDTNEKVRINAQNSFRELDLTGKKIESLQADTDKFKGILQPLSNNKNAKQLFIIVDEIEIKIGDLSNITDEKEFDKKSNEIKTDFNNAKEETIKLKKESNLSREEHKALDNFLKQLDQAFISLSKIGLSNGNTITERKNDEIFERTLLKNLIETKEIQNQVTEKAFIGLSEYYLALKDMSKEIETVNSEKSSKKNKEQKVEEIFEKHYDNLKNGNENHDKTLNSFLIYNMTMEFGSKEQKENISKEIKVKTEDGKETTLKNRCNKEFLELIPIKE